MSYYSASSAYSDTDSHFDGGAQTCHTCRCQHNRRYARHHDEHRGRRRGSGGSRGSRYIDDGGPPPAPPERVPTVAPKYGYPYLPDPYPYLPDCVGCPSEYQQPYSCVPPNLGVSPCLDANRVQCRLDARRAALDRAQAQVDALRSDAGCAPGPGPSCPVGLWDPVCAWVQGNSSQLPMLKTFTSECEMARYASMNPGSIVYAVSRGPCRAGVDDWVV